MDTITQRPCQKLPDEKRRDRKVVVRLNDGEYFALQMTARRMELSLSEALRRLVQEENERNHYDLIEPEFVRRQNRETS